MSAVTDVVIHQVVHVHIEAVKGELVQTSSNSRFLRHRWLYRAFPSLRYLIVFFLFLFPFFFFTPYLFLSSRFHSSTACTRHPAFPPVSSIIPTRNTVWFIRPLCTSHSTTMLDSEIFFFGSKKKKRTALFVFFCFLPLCFPFVSIFFFFFFFITRALPCPAIFHNYAGLWATIKIRGACRSRDGWPDWIFIAALFMLDLSFEDALSSRLMRLTYANFSVKGEYWSMFRVITRKVLENS